MLNQPTFSTVNSAPKPGYLTGFYPGQLLLTGVLILLLTTHTFGQSKPRMVRTASIIVDQSQLVAYRFALTEEIEASMRLEPGVLTLYAVADKAKPHHITILEIYADSAAYKRHIQTPHFLKYKTGTQHMVRSLILTETVPLIPGMKIKE